MRRQGCTSTPFHLQRALLLPAVAILSLAVQTTTAQAGKIPWGRDVNAALATASAEQRLVLVHFWDDGCPPCIRLERNVYSRPEVQRAISANYVPVKVKVSEARSLARKYQVDRWPTDIILSHDGKVLYQGVSQQDPNRYILRMDQVAAAARTNQQVAPARQLVQSQLPPRQKTAPSMSRSNAFRSGKDDYVAGNPGGGSRNSAFQLPNLDPLAGQRQAVRATTQPGYAQQLIAPNNRSKSGSSAASQPAAPPKPQLTSNRYVTPESPTTAPTGAPATRAPANSAQPTPTLPGRQATTRQQPTPAATPNPYLTNRAPTGAPSEYRPPASNSSAYPVPNPTAAPTRQPELASNRPGQPTNPQYVPPQRQRPTGSLYPSSTQPHPYPRSGTANNSPQPANNRMPIPNPHAAPANVNRAPAQANVGDVAAGTAGRMPLGNQPNALQPNQPQRNDYRPQVGSYATTNANTRPQPVVAFEGYCPVALAGLDGKPRWILGNANFRVQHRRQTYQFHSAAAAAAFQQNPDRFAPTIGGYDVTEFVEHGRWVPGKRAHGITYRNKIYLFSSEASLDRFVSNRQWYAEQVSKSGF